MAVAEVNGKRWLAGGVLAFVIVVPMLHIHGPVYPHPAQHHAVATAAPRKPAEYNPYLPLGAASPSAKPSHAAKSGHHAGAFMLGRMAYHVRPHFRGWRPWRRIRLNPLPWWMR